MSRSTVLSARKSAADGSVQGNGLPSARALSGYLSVSRSTVDLAYEQLVSEGYLESVPCKGYFVCEIEGLYHLDERRGDKKDDAAEQMPFRYDFRRDRYGASGFPQNSWKKISKKSRWTQMTACSSSGMRRASTVFGRQSATICTRTRRELPHGADHRRSGNDYLLMLLSGDLRGVAIKWRWKIRPTSVPTAVLRSLACDVYDFDGRRGMRRRSWKAGADLAYIDVAPVPDGMVSMPMKRRMQLPCVGIEGKWAVSD